MPGCLFAALPGYKTDGHRFISQALALGASAVLCEHAPEEAGPWIVVPDARAALAAVSANWFGRPADRLTALAVTGTNGKTTTTYLLKAMLEGVLGAKVGLIGTNQNMIGGAVLPAHRTTPESWEVQKLLREMADAGCTHVVMEASSHAMVLHRVDGIRFAAGIFTNLTRDHLDFHGTMEAYRDAKGRLFRQTDTAVLNLDDEAGRYFASTVACPKLTYSENKDDADLTAPQKFLLQLAAAILFTVLMRNHGYLSNALYVPFFHVTFLIPWPLYMVFAAFVMVGTVNAVNITDGIDGLAAGVTMPVALFFTAAACFWARYELGVFAAALFGGLCAFLIYNFYPAKVFMGDTGSLFLGGAVCGLAFALDIPLILITVGVIYIVETLSDILQVGYFKLSHGKRIFRMAPLHHHLEMGGWSEVKLFCVFTGITAVTCVLSFWGVMNR